MEKVTLFDNLINTPKEIRNATIANFAALMGVDTQTLHTLLTCYYTAQHDNANEMRLDLTFGGFCAPDAARVLDAAGVRSVLVADKSTTVLKVLHAFLSAGWQVSADTINDKYDGDRPALRLSRR